MRDEPAFPSEKSINNYRFLGLTKREYFAGLAMQGILASGEVPDSVSGVPIQTMRHNLVCEAIACADALLAELSKEQP